MFPPFDRRVLGQRHHRTTGDSWLPYQRAGSATSRQWTPGLKPGRYRGVRCIRVGIVIQVTPASTKTRPPLSGKRAQKECPHKLSLELPSRKPQGTIRIASRDTVSLFGFCQSHCRSTRVLALRIPPFAQLGGSFGIHRQFPRAAQHALDSNVTIQIWPMHRTGENLVIQSLGFTGVLQCRIEREGDADETTVLQFEAEPILRNVDFLNFRDVHSKQTLSQHD